MHTKQQVYYRQYQHLALPGSELIQQHRQHALEKLSNLGLPDQKDEDWNYLRIPSLAHRYNNDAVLNQATMSFLTNCKLTQGLVFIDGHYQACLSKLPQLHALKICSLPELLVEQPDSLIPYLKINNQENHFFYQLNQTFLNKGAYIHIQTSLQDPLELIFITTESDQFIPLHIMIIAEENTQARIVQRYLTRNADHYFTNTVTSLHLAAHSQIEHSTHIHEAKTASHIAYIKAQQNYKSQLHLHSFIQQGAFVRNEIEVHLAQTQAQCHLNGLYLASDQQQVAQHTRVIHKAAKSISRQLYKGVLDQEAHASFKGSIMAYPEAIGAEAKQLNKNLLLSDKAEVNSRPQLEIFVDDIRCTHGATVGQLDPAALFYLRTRGLSVTQARTHLIQAFIQECLAYMPLIKDTLEQAHPLS